MFDEQEFEAWLQDVLTELDSEEQSPGSDVYVKRVRTYASAALLTRDRGLVVTMSDGSQFQVTVKQA